MAIRGKRIVLIGDSHMEALGPRLKRLLEAQGNEVGFVAKRGWSSRRYLASAEGRDALGMGALGDVVVIELGGNNREFDEREYRNQIGQVLRATGKPSSSIIWVGPPASNAAVAPEVAQHHERTSRLQRRIVPMFRARWVDSRPMTRSGWAPDGVHFTREGYDRWASKLVRGLEGGSSWWPWALGGAVLVGGVVIARRRAR